MNIQNLTNQEKLFFDKQVDNISKDINVDLSVLVKNIPDDNEILLLGENTHGTKEFYTHRSLITKFMIENMGYKVVLLEAEWPDIIRINNYILGESIDNSAKESLGSIKQSSNWLWNNKVICQLIEWLKEYNLHHPFNKVYIFGIDCQQFLKSIKFVLEYLKSYNHPYYEKTKLILAIFRQFITESQYAVGAVHGSFKPMVTNIVNNIQALLSNFQWDHVDSFLDDPEVSKKDKLDRMSCEQSFEIIVNGEEYFRKMLEEPSGSNASWNTRDQHMLMTIMRIRNRFCQIFGETPKILVWAHNSHIGNSIATSRGGKTFANNNSWNVGQMVKEMFPKSTAIGFYTANGTVTSAFKDQNRGISQELISPHILSYENLFKNVCTKLNINEFFIDLRNYKDSEDGNNSTQVRLNEKYRDLLTGEIFIAANVITEKNKITYLIDANNNKHLFINPYSSIIMRCRLLNSFNYSCNKRLFNSNLLQRWIGVNYIKETEIESHYGESKLAKQFDFVVFISETTHLT